MTIIFAILIFSFLIFIHEFGHFIAAKLSGVQVNEFAMFMGPAIFKWKRGETQYSVRCIPIGGYCAMEGEDTDTDSPRSFQKAAWWKRLCILVAGSFMNLVVGVLIMLIIYLPVKQIATPVIENFQEKSTVNGEFGLQEGDQIWEIDGERVYVLSDFSLIMTLNPGDVHDLVVVRNGEKVVLNDFVMEKHEMENAYGNTELLYGINFKWNNSPTIGDKLALGWANAVDSVRNVRLSLQMLFTGKASFKEVGGPVMIVDQMNQVAQASATKLDALLNMLYFGGFIAINLAVMNMLPIPALDGGRVFFLLVTTAFEAIFKKKIDPKYEGYIHGVCMVLLLILMAVILFKDVFTIFTR
ncbi:MAG: site-2 protease family protein [Oscillospiraceae bacterium]|nr:site-2 protease family protein [Oscillospiraceae bacterium]